MKRVVHFLVVFLVLFSCTKNKEEIKVEKTIVKKTILNISNIIKNRDDIKFKLNNGVLFYEKKPYSGIVNIYYDTVQLKSIAQYFEGRKEGAYKGFYKSGKKWFIRQYSKGIKVKTHRSWYENGMQKFEYQFNDDGEYDGFVKEWYSNGQMRKYFNFKKGKESGAQKMWQSTGKIKANFYTINGDRHGLIGLKNCVSVLDKIEVN